MNTGLDGIRASRRDVLAAGTGGFAVLLVGPARATPESMAAAIQSFVGGSAFAKGPGRS